MKDLVRCFICEATISDTASVCPKCGDVDPHYVGRFLDYIASVFKEFDCPLNRSEMLDQFGDNRFKLSYKIYDRIVSDSVTSISNVSPPSFLGSLPSFVTSNFKSSSFKQIEKISLHHNFIVTAIDRTIFDETSGDMGGLKLLGGYFLSAITRPPYYTLFPSLSKVKLYPTLEKAILNFDEV